MSASTRLGLLLPASQWPCSYSRRPPSWPLVSACRCWDTHRCWLSCWGLTRSGWRGGNTFRTDYFILRPGERSRMGFSTSYPRFSWTNRGSRLRLCGSRLAPAWPPPWRGDSIPTPDITPCAGMSSSCGRMWAEAGNQSGMRCRQWGSLPCLKRRAAQQIDREAGSHPGFGKGDSFPLAWIGYANPGGAAGVRGGCHRHRLAYFHLCESSINNKSIQEQDLNKQ